MAPRVARCFRWSSRWVSRSKAIEPNPIGLRRTFSATGRRLVMTTMSRIKEHMEVIGAGGVHVGTVDRVENNRIKLTKADSGEGKHKGRHHYVDGSLVADVEGKKVRVSANGDVAVTMEQ